MGESESREDQGKDGPGEGFMLNATLVGGRELIQRFAGAGSAVQSRMNVVVQAYTLDLQSYVVGSKLSGQVLNVRTGNLRRSIQQRLTINEASVYGYVYSSGDVKYAAIHEFGGIIQHPGGTKYIIDAAVGGNIMTRFVSNAFPGHVAGVTKPHPIPMPERSFLRSGLRDKSASYTEGMVRAAKESLAAQVMGKSV